MLPGLNLKIIHHHPVQLNRNQTGNTGNPGYQPLPLLCL
jgi:hypothetical protein